MMFFHHNNHFGIVCGPKNYVFKDLISECGTPYPLLAWNVSLGEVPMSVSVHSASVSTINGTFHKHYPFADEYHSEHRKTML